MWVSLYAGIAGGGPQTKAPAGAAGRGLAFEVCQALVGAVLLDYDDYYDLVSDGVACHAAHAITRTSDEQGSERLRAPGLGDSGHVVIGQRRQV